MTTIKRFSVLALLLSLLVLGACSTGGGYPSWSYGNRPEAKEAPSPLSEIYAERLAVPATQGNGQSRIETQSRQGIEGTLPEDSAPDTNFENADYNAVQYNAAQGESFKATPMPVAATPPPTANVKVALLLPMSGQHEALGKAMLKAAQMALFDVGHEGFELLPRDTSGTPEGASTAARLAIEDGAQLILGPVFADSVRAARRAISGYNINMIAFSTDWTLASSSSFVMGFLPFDQVERVTRYAASQNILTAGVLAPDTPYGSAVTSTYRAIAPRLGIMTEDIQLFDPASRNLSSAVRSFAKYDERVESLNQIIRPLKARLKIAPESQELEDTIKLLENMDTMGEVPFEAILLPVGGDQARALANLASHYDLLPSKVRRLGTGLWDDKGLASEPGLDGAWFAAPAPGQRSEFERRYRQLYGKRPPRLTSLAYDATALAAVLARSGLQTTGQPAFDRDSISNPNGFAGVDGIFRFRSDGLIERGLAVLEYRGGQIVVVDEAPNTFQRPEMEY